MKKKILVAALATVMTAPAFAGVPALIEKIPGHPVVLQSSPVPGTSLRAFLIKAGTHMGVVYTGPKGDYLFAGGEIMTRTGPVNIAQKLFSDYYATHDFSALAKTLKQKATTVHQGHAGPMVYVFWDPSCIFCHKLWDELQPAIKAGKIQVNWVPVGFLKPSSPAKAATILAAPSPLAAMRTDERRFKVRVEEGGITPQKHVPAKYVQEMRANTHLFETSGMQGTPSIIYQGAKRQWHVIPGFTTTDALLKAAH
ncbi:thiol:disulfide interchange protein DsbG [Acidihalobacter ferrooxydans]|uniref:Thiol:disulfide interchange protein n=1 Tax=Acidihalobacter ferrooxydans TaxID=1765967 RepID=A0A1P8UFN9_9GAMM|nr:thiol:disulfide interchange protein DsbG [Acidihalobacter ferrooxydans]APZ42638.1 thiol:disulfide interchange protein DsbG [Acidihalobacter ferrooxydans]